MATVSETIPDVLQPEVDAALAWFNRSQADEFEVTGIIDAELAVATNGARELQLVLCGGDTCQQQSFVVSGAAQGFDVAYANPNATSEASAEPQAELDPPPGPRRAWLDTVLGQHAFVVLVFYRGFW